MRLLQLQHDLDIALKNWFGSEIYYHIGLNCMRGRRKIYGLHLSVHIPKIYVNPTYNTFNIKEEIRHIINIYVGDVIRVIKSRGIYHFGTNPLEYEQFVVLLKEEKK